jgi:hypothetical protein
VASQEGLDSLYEYISSEHLHTLNRLSTWYLKFPMSVDGSLCADNSLLIVGSVSNIKAYRMGKLKRY